MKGFTRLDNEKDLAYLLALPTGQVKAALVLMQHRHLSNPVVSVETLMATLGVSRRRVYQIMGSLSCAISCTGGWRFGAENFPVSEVNCTDQGNKLHESGKEIAQPPVKKLVLDPPPEAPKEVERIKEKEKEQQLQLNTHHVMAQPEARPKRLDFARPQPPNARGQLLLSLRQRGLEQRFNQRLRAGMRDAAWFDWLDTLIPQYERLGEEFPEAVRQGLDALASAARTTNDHRYFAGVVRRYLPRALQPKAVGQSLSAEEIARQIAQLDAEIEAQRRAMRGEPYATN
jgi:hypothetical protein